MNAVSAEYVAILVASLGFTLGTIKWMFQKYQAHIEARFDTLDGATKGISTELHTLGMRVAKLEGRYELIDRFITHIVDRNHTNKST